MTHTADVVVVGGGVNGASIACALAARGVRPALVEKGALASGASGRSSALVRMHYTNEWDARLAWASYPIFRDWPARMGGPPVFTRTGFLNLVGPEHADRLRRNVAMLRGIGIDTEAVGPAEVRELQPFMRVDDVGAAAYEPQSGYASPADVVDGFRRRARELGGQVLEWTPVTAVRHRSGRVTGVETAAGAIAAPAVVLAAGAWAVGLCRGLGVALPARVKAIDTVLVARPPELAAPHMTVIDTIQSTYFRPESTTLTIVGVPCAEYDVDPDTLATGLPPHAAPAGAELLAHRIPAMERATLARGFRAFDLYSADRHAILDRVEGWDGLYLATAFSGAGFKIAPAVGTCMAELILDGAARTVDIRPFGLRRFAEGKPLEGSDPYTPRADRAGVPGVVV
jgi:glycine/D-amino acid oxidase-like deaminating enzyme